MSMIHRIRAYACVRILARARTCVYVNSKRELKYLGTPQFTLQYTWMHTYTPCVLPRLFLVPR